MGARKQVSIFVANTYFVTHQIAEPPEFVPRLVYGSQGRVVLGFVDLSDHKNGKE